MMRTRRSSRAAAVAAAAALGTALAASPAPALPPTTTRPVVVRAAAPSTVVPATTKADRILPPVAGRPAWLVVRRGVAAMQGGHRVSGVLTFSGDRPYELTGTVDPSTADARVTYHHVETDPTADPSDSLPMELRLTATTAYRRLPEAMSRDLLADWYSFDLSNASPDSTPTETLVAQWFIDAPACALAVDTWRELPSTRVGGTRLRHFRGSAALLETVQLLADSKGFLPRLDVEVWADTAGRIRRVRWTASPDPTYKGKPAPTVRLDASYTALGTPLVVTRPAGRIIDAAAIYG